ncbi:MAG: hypothetical protein AAGK09_04800 [Planctomycetota bacterium]
MIPALRCSAAAVLAASSVCSVNAGTLTDINPPANPFAEPSLAEVLQTVVGSPVDPTGPLRVHDSLDHAFYAAASFRLTYVGSYWGLGSLLHDVDVFANGALVGAGANASGAGFGPADLRVDAYNPDSDVTASTDPAYSFGGQANGPLDRVVTFDVTAFDALNDAGGNPLGLIPAERRYLLFFEAGSDRDYQDFILLIEIDAPLNAAPSPSAFAGGLLLGGVTLLRRRR